MQMQNLQDLFLEDLKDLYNAEAQLLKALPRMAKAAHSPQLKEALTLHAEQTRGHAERLQEIFSQLGKPARGRKCKAMEGIIEEGNDILKDEKRVEPQVLDAALIGAAQKVEHYEIAGYGTVRTYAKLLGNKEAARLLQQILDEEGQTDKKLTRLAERFVNAQARQAGQ